MIPVTEDLLHKLFKFYDAMQLAKEIEKDPEQAAYVFYSVLKKVYDDREASKKKT